MFFIINGIRWDIRLVDPRNSIFITSDNYYTIGVCDLLTKTIYLANNLEGSMLKKVLCHEVAHAAIYSYNINLSLNKEEIIADWIATYGQEIFYITNKIYKELQ